MFALSRYTNIKIKNDFLYESDSTHQPTNQPEKLPREMIVELMRKNGVVGLGGSGFSTYIKYLKPASIHTVLINGVECEPYLTTDYHGIFHQEKRLFDGIKFLMKSAEPRIDLKMKENMPSMLTETGISPMFQRSIIFMLPK